ncbi:COP9 signalosome complex subunit 6 [Exophiala dermatitidis]
MAQPTDNPLVSSKPSDSGLSVSLHPLVLLTVSDQVTRHSVRQQAGPVAGALLGQQIGRQITAEHAFPVSLVKIPEGQWRFNAEWMETRIQQYKDVHKSPALEFVGWYTLCPRDGPLPELIPLQKQAITFYNDSAILLALHPELVKEPDTATGKLPITIYESVIDAEHAQDDESMQVDGEELSAIKFKQLPYTIDTDETEMIAIDYVAKGAGSAALLDEAGSTEPAVATEQSSADKKGKQRADDTAPEASSEQKAAPASSDSSNFLSPEEEDQIANITTRLNSVKMLQSRISLLRGFIQSLPPPYISDQQSAQLTSTSPDPSHLSHLRNIQALITRLSLLTPSSSTAAKSTSSAQPGPLAAASQAQSNDVALANMLAIIGQDIQALSELGRKFATVEGSRGPKGRIPAGTKNGAGGGGPAGAGLEEGNGRFGGIAAPGGGSGVAV